MLTAAALWILFAATTTITRPPPAPQFTAYSCDTTNQTTVGGQIFSAVRLAHPQTPGSPRCPSYNASADPLGPCFVTPEFTKAYLDRLPTGHRSISLEGQPTLYTVSIGAQEIPRHLDCFDEIAPGVKGPWLDDWSRVVRARFEVWFGKFHAIGGGVDIVMLDWENNAPFFQWVAQPGGAAALAADPRWPPLCAQLNALGSEYNVSFPAVPSQSEMESWGQGKQGMRQWVWNEEINRLIARTINETIVLPLQKLYPKLIINNFSHKYRSNPAAVAWWPYQFGNSITPPAGTGTHVGTHQGGSFCEWITASISVMSMQAIFSHPVRAQQLQLNHACRFVFAHCKLIILSDAALPSVPQMAPATAARCCSVPASSARAAWTPAHSTCCCCTLPSPPTCGAPHPPSPSFLGSSPAQPATVVASQPCCPSGRRVSSTCRSARALGASCGGGQVQISRSAEGCRPPAPHCTSSIP